MAVQVVSGSSPYADITQDMSNDMPDWHVMRRQRDSLSAKILNSAYGRSLSKIVDYELPNLFTQSYLGTANPLINDVAYISDISNTKIHENRVYNKILNSNFSEWLSIIRLPDYWKIKSERESNLINTLHVDVLDNYLGGNSLEVYSKSDPFIDFGKVSMYQTVDNTAEISKSLEWTLFVHHKDKSGTIVSDYFMLEATVTYETGSVEYFSTSINGALAWSKTSLKNKR